MRIILLILLIPCSSLAQSERNVVTSSPTEIKPYAASKSMGTFAVEYNSSIQRTAMPDKMDFTEGTLKTSDGGTSTYLISREVYQESLEHNTTTNPISVIVSPNPFNISTSFTIKTDVDVNEIVFEVYDLFGRLVKSMSMQTLTFSFEKNNLSDGLYFYRIKIYSEEREEKTESGKFIINSIQLDKQ